LEAGAGVMAKAEFHFGELFPRVGFIVTNLATSGRVRFYNKRGTLSFTSVQQRVVKTGGRFDQA
jgi:hypothetical protein